MSNHFKHSLKLILVALVLLFGAFLYLTHCIRAFVSSYKAQYALSQNIKGQLSFNEKTHILIVTTHKRHIREYAKNPEVIVTETDDVIIHRHLSSFEDEWFIGVGYADCGRVFIGSNFYHFGRFDLHGEMGIAPDTTKVVIKPYIGVGYNVWSNTSLNLAINPFTMYTNPQIGGFVSVRF